MASNIVSNDPELHGATPVKGNYTTDSTAHLWCASALAHVVANDDALAMWADDVQQALRFLLSCEVSRARAAALAEASMGPGRR